MFRLRTARRFPVLSPSLLPSFFEQEKLQAYLQPWCLGTPTHSRLGTEGLVKARPSLGASQAVARPVLYCRLDQNSLTNLSASLLESDTACGQLFWGQAGCFKQSARHASVSSPAGRGLNPSPPVQQVPNPVMRPDMLTGGLSSRSQVSTAIGRTC